MAYPIAQLSVSPTQLNMWGPNVLQNIERRKLKVDRDIPVHGAIAHQFGDHVVGCFRALEVGGSQSHRGEQRPHRLRPFLGDFADSRSDCPGR